MGQKQDIVCVTLVFSILVFGSNFDYPNLASALPADPDNVSIPLINTKDGFVQTQEVTSILDSGIIGHLSPNILTGTMNITSISIIVDGSSLTSGTMQGIILSNVTATNNYEDAIVEGLSSNTVDLTTASISDVTTFFFDPPATVSDDETLFFGFNYTSDGVNGLEFEIADLFDVSNVGTLMAVNQTVGDSWVADYFGSDTWLGMEVKIELDSPVPLFNLSGGIAPDNLVVYLTFDVPEQKATTDSENIEIHSNAGSFGHNASAVNMENGGIVITNSDSSGKFGDALPIQPSEKHLITSLKNIHDFDFINDDATNLWGISFWLNSASGSWETLEDYASILSNMGGAEVGIRIMVDGLSKNVVVDIGNDGGLIVPDLASSSTLTDNSWTLVGLVVNKTDPINTVRLYINGTEENSASADFGNGLTQLPDQTLLAIGETIVAEEDWGGKVVDPTQFNIDDLCIWKDYLPTATDMSDLYNGGTGQTCSTAVPLTSGDATLKITKLTTGGDDTFDFTVTGTTSYNPSINTASGIGIDGPTQVDPGTYFIQETIPVGWDLTIASCNDGSSSFSVDTVSGIDIGFGDNIECTFENEFSSSDTDGDGIYDDVDTLPNSASDDFSDIGLGGTTFGTITTRGDQTLAVTEEPNPDGVRIVADLSGGILPAIGDACGGIANILMTAGDNIVVTCSSIRIDVTNGPVEITFIGSGGMQATTTLTQGNSITFNPDEFSFVVPLTNPDPVVIIVDGEQIILEAGQAANILSSNKDSFLKQGESNTNEGISTMMRVRADGNNRALVSFDQIEILAAAQDKTLSFATLRLYIEDNGNNWGSEGRTIDIHRLLDDWTEGDGFNDKPSNMILSEFNTLKTRGDGPGVTWKCSTDSEINNQQPDCDPQWDGASYSLTPTDTVTIFKNHPPTGTVKTVGWIEFDVTSDVQTFISSTEQNYGWLVKKTAEGDPGSIEFSSGQSSVNIPELVLVFE